ncbi:MAG TPA: glycoside hydrolase family 9 protein [Bacteroidales bacterium]|nr:glycoside hydrolase family 9 protein [Bacteroidales bacterium]
MKKAFFTLLIFVPFLAQSQTRQANAISSVVGEALPSTGTEQIVPQLGNIAAVAPDVLCIEIDACRILPCIQIPYIPDPADVITESGKTPLGETRNMFVVRDGFPLGTLVGPDRKTITLYERVVGKNLDTDAADMISSYHISSPGDENFKKGVKPEKVLRKSKPTGWVDESWQLSKKQFATAKHFIYLKLPYALKTGQTYLISMPALKINHSAAYYVHDPVYVRSEAVHVSQIGFRADDPDKNAFLSLWMGNGGGYTYPENLEFSLINDITNEMVFKGKAVMQWKAGDPEGIGTKINHSATDVIRLDFSSYNIPGRYRVCVEGIGCGYPFSIDEAGTWRHAFELSMKGVFQHRSGIPMLPPYTDFVRPRSFNPLDGVKVYQSTCSLLNSGNGLNAMGTDKNNFGNLVAGKTDIIVPDAWGGYMDAGDWDRRINHLLTPRLYLELFEMNPEYFKDVCLNIPESSNDLPDIVDEAIFGLDVYRRMQTAEGGIRGGIESSEHPVEGGTSWQEIHTVMAYAPDHWSSYLYTGVASRAALILRSLGKADAAGMWEASAVNAMEWAEVEYRKWITSADYSKVTERAKNAVPVERNLAAVELYRLTNNKKWHEVFLSTQGSCRTDAAFIYARLDKSLVNKKAQEAAVKLLLDEADQMVELSANNAFGLTTGSPGRAISGYSSTYTIPASTTLARAHYLTGNPQYLKTILRSALYSAGANPMNLCLTTGLGENPVRNALHEDTKHTGQPAPIGITVFGPCELPFSDARPGGEMETRLNVTTSPAISNWPSAEAFFDVFWFVPQNEYVIDRPLGQTAYIWGYLDSRRKN